MIRRLWVQGFEFEIGDVNDVIWSFENTKLFNFSELNSIQQCKYMFEKR